LTNSSESLESNRAAGFRQSDIKIWGPLTVDSDY